MPQIWKMIKEYESRESKHFCRISLKFHLWGTLKRNEFRRESRNFKKHQKETPRSNKWWWGEIEDHNISIPTQRRNKYAVDELAASWDMSCYAYCIPNPIKVAESKIKHGWLARWFKWKSCGVGKAKDGLENELWRR